MPRARAKERRRRHGASKKSPRKKKLSSQADIKEVSNGSQRQSSNPIANPPMAPRQSSSSAVSANWKNLAKQLGLDSSHSRKEKRIDSGKSKVESSKNNSKFISPGKRKKMTVEASQSKRRKLDDTGVGRVAGGVPEQQQAESTENILITGSDISAGRSVSLDCEMVGTGPAGDFSMLARCSVVNHHGNVLYDSYVAPMDKITDYRTKFSGITPQHLRGAPDFKNVQKEISQLIQGRILIGHAIHYDLKALLLSHPWRDIRDTSKFKQFRQLSKGKAPSLKKLAKEILSVDIQQNYHDSVEDARASMRLYQLHKQEWEAIVKAKRRSRTGHRHKDT